MPKKMAPRWLAIVINRRVPISIVLFASLAIWNIAVHNRPRDVTRAADPIVVISLAVICAGLAVRSWAAGTLRKSKTLATTGPYACVRHPLYVGSFLMMFGFCTLLSDPLTVWVVIGPIVWIYWLTVNREEHRLARLFPDQWPAYAKRTPQFIPSGWRLLGREGWSLGQWLHNEEYQAWLGSVMGLVGLKLWQLWG